MPLPRENVWDYPRPPRLEQVPQELVIIFAGRAIAATRAGWRVLETSHPPVYYLPRDCFTCEVIASTRRRSFCEWKGSAAYWSLKTDGRTATDCAWSYPDPVPAFAAIRDHLAVYPAAMDRCTVEGEAVTPQPGGFYGGWITLNLVGPFKGEPGTSHW